MKKVLVRILPLLLIAGCATYEAKYTDPSKADDVQTRKEISHTFYLIGDAGLSPMGELNPALEIFKKKLQEADSNSTAIFLGDNIYPAGLPDPQDSTLRFLRAKNHLDAQIATVQDYKGRVIFIPGNHDWYTEGLIGLKRQEIYIEETLDRKDSFLPEDGCPIEKVEINEDIVAIVMDTEWYLTNWDRRPSINQNCDVKSREKFLQELESLIKKNADKTVLLLTHHPVFSYGSHGGQFTLRHQFYPSHNKGPLPVLGTLVNLFRKTAGASVEDMQNKRYRELINRITTLARFTDKPIIASGHEHTLQYIVERELPQIVSGSGAKKGASTLLNGAKFTTGRMGYATLEIYKDGSSRVRFYGVNEQEGGEEFLYTTQIHGRDTTVNEYKFPDEFPQTIDTSIYSQDEVDRSKFFQLIWGERYRKYYGTEVTVPIVELDTLFGGLEPVRAGGGQQTKSLRLRHDSGKEYVMRSLRKQAERFLQAMAFKDQYIIGEFEETYTEGLLEDFYTGAHPYAPLTIPPLSEAAGVFHTNPKLYYIPKQPALGDFNADFGDELYLLEEHVSKGHEDLKSFGYAEDIKSTYDFLDKLRADEKYTLDTDLYIRARLFDMVIGDWDRHQDQWRWAEFEISEDSVVYKPIPRDRDQVYSIMGDGLLMNVSMSIIPALKKMEGFRDQIRNVRMFNSNPYSLDMALLSETTYDSWQRQVEHLKSNLTPEVISASLNELPAAVRDDHVSRIKSVILNRLKDLDKIANDYFKALNRAAIVVGTDKDDIIEINGLPGRRTEVKAFRNIKGKKGKLFYHKIFDRELTREIWIYGLGDDDIFMAGGDADNHIRIRIVGGDGTDKYDISGQEKITIYDYASKDITIENEAGSRVRLSDDYQLNTYEPLKVKATYNQIIPTIGFNPDDGMRIGLNNRITHYGFRQNPFTALHEFNASYYFATNGFDVSYSGEFANLFDTWNFAVDTRFTSPNYSVNFFGFGNNTSNPEDALGMDFNRVRLRQFRFNPSIVWRGPLGGTLELGLGYEDIEVERTVGRFIDQFDLSSGYAGGDSFLGAGARYYYENTDSQAFPTLGMAAGLTTGIKKNLNGSGDNFGFVIPMLALDHKLLPNGKVVLATKWKGHLNIGNGYEFYQAASLGGSDGPRGFRNQRYIGKSAYYQNTDLRFLLREMRTGLLPVTIGSFVGFDYGRVWSPGISSKRWHTSYGGGIFISGADLFSARASLFYGGEGPRFSFGLGFGF